MNENTIVNRFNNKMKKGRLAILPFPEKRTISDFATPNISDFAPPPTKIQFGYKILNFLLKKKKENVY